MYSASILGVVTVVWVFPHGVQVLVKLFTDEPPSPYILAVDDAKSTLAQVVSAISAGLGSGGVAAMAPADADALVLKEEAVADLQVCRLVGCVWPAACGRGVFGCVFVCC